MGGRVFGMGVVLKVAHVPAFRADTRAMLDAKFNPIRQGSSPKPAVPAPASDIYASEFIAHGSPEAIGAGLRAAQQVALPPGAAMLIPIA